MKRGIALGVIAVDALSIVIVSMIPNSTAADQTVPARTIFEQNGGRGLPKRTFKDKMTLTN